MVHSSPNLGENVHVFSFFAYISVTKTDTKKIVQIKNIVY